MPSEKSDPVSPEMDPEPVLAAMREFGVSLSPENYHLWFEYVGGRNEALNRRIDAIKGTADGFTQQINQELYAEHIFSPQERSSQRQAQKKSHAILRQALNTIPSTESRASDYHNDLENYTGALSEVTDLRGLARLVKDLVVETQRMDQSTLRFKGELDEAMADVDRLRRELDEAVEDSSRDPLTGLFNRHSVDKKIEELLQEFRTDDRLFSVVMLDIDNFRAFNTEYGHQIGDAVLRVVSTSLKESVKGLDFVARYGGEEFIVFLPNTKLQDACRAAENIGRNISAKRHKMSATGKRLSSITVSLGISQISKTDTADTVIERADKCLYLAKDSGRNNAKSEEDLKSLEPPKPPEAT